MVLETPQNFTFDRGEVELLILTGPDTDDFLNRLSTLNFKKEINGSAHGAFLNGQAKLISLFTAWKEKNQTYLFVEKNMFENTAQYLEKMHFAENLKIETKKYFCVEVRENRDFASEMQVAAYDFGIPGKYFFSTQKFNVQSISEKQYDAIRAAFGFPKPLVDLTSDHILIEGPMDKFLDRNKGCYPGQEVIEKIYTYGRVARKIKIISFELVSHHDLQVLESKLPLELEFAGNNIGKLTSVFSGDKSFGIVTLKRHFYEKNHTLEIPLASNQIINARVREDGLIA